MSERVKNLCFEQWMVAKDAFTQIQRWYSILEYLGRDNFTSKVELAQIFDLSVRQVERILKTFEDVGITLSHERGKGYRILRQAHSLPLRLSIEEAWALLLFQRCCLRKLGYGAQKTLKILSQKVLRKITPESQNALKQLDPWVATDELEEDLPSETWQAITESLARSLQIHFYYQKLADRQAMHRKVDPWGLFVVRGCWYLQGYDHTRKQERNFRLNRMRDVKLTAIPSQRQNNYSMAANLFHRFDLGSGPEIEVGIHCDLLLCKWLQENPLHPSQTVIFNGVKVQIRNVDLLFDTLMSLSGLNYLTPPEVHQQFLDRIEQKLNRLRTGGIDSLSY